MCATRGLHVLLEDTTDDGGHLFEKGSTVFEGWYFERYPDEARWSPTQHHYYADRGLVIKPNRVLMYTHLVRKIGFELPEVKTAGKKKKTTIYSVSDELHEALMTACSV